jgi:integrase
MAEAGNPGAVAVALQLSLGLRSREVLGRRVRDLDEGGTVLLITHGKTANARRRPEVPDFLRPHLLKLAASKPADAFLFGAGPSGKPRLTGFLIRQVHKVCEHAGVPKVCAHSLRGLHATLALRQGVSSQAVASALGHGSFAVTARHYADPTQLLNTRVRAVLGALRDPGGSDDVAVPELVATLQGSLSVSQVQHLIRLLSDGILAN